MDQISKKLFLIKRPFLIKGDIYHARHFPKQNSFNYKSIYFSVPLAKISNLKRRFFGVDRFNLLSFFNKDHGDKKSKNLRVWIDDILAKYDIKADEIVLVSHPRFLGYVFNPVSFWLCFEGEKLIAVLSEVNNTCGQRHNYLCFKDEKTEIRANEWIESKKEFYVSPFMEIEGNYKFRFELLENGVNFFINYVVDGQLKLATSLKCHFSEFNNFNILKAVVRYPFFTFKTVFLIHYQALKLYLKKITFYKCPPKLKNNLTISSDGK
ncbi:MAG: DUF1365 domain-containing protein [Rickettsiales bacterium]|nr:DUF1365 domain-containing protein [Rickettsiales bacterium]